MAMQDTCVRSMNSIHMPNKQLFVDIRPPADELQLKEPALSANELSIRVRKPYTITKQRERWTKEEHEKFLDAIKLHGRAWRRIQEHIGTKTVIQIRSHAQKFFSKVVRDSDIEKAIEIPPPRPKRKPLHPYPRKLDNLCTTIGSSLPVSSVSDQESGSPVSVLSTVGSDILGSSVSKPQNSCASPLSTVVGSDPVELSSSEQEHGCCFPTTSVKEDRILSLGLASNILTKLDESPTESDLGSKDQISPKEVSPEEAELTSLKLFGRTVLVTNSLKTCFSDDGKAAQCFKAVPNVEVGSREEKIEMDMRNRASSFVHFSAYKDLCESAGAGRIAAPPMYFLLVPNSVQTNSADGIAVPVPFWWTFYGSSPLPLTNQLNMSLKQVLPQTSTEDAAQVIAQKEGSSTASSSGSSWNESIMDDGDHIAVSCECSGLPKEPARPFRLKPSENSAFVSVKASNNKPARGFMPYERYRSRK